MATYTEQATQNIKVSQEYLTGKREVDALFVKVEEVRTTYRAHKDMLSEEDREYASEIFEDIIEELAAAKKAASEAKYHFDRNVRDMIKNEAYLLERDAKFSMKVQEMEFNNEIRDLVDGAHADLQDMFDEEDFSF